MARQTKAQRAHVIKERVHIGPSISLFGVEGEFARALTAEQRRECVDYFAAQYRIWANTWIRPGLEELLPK